MFTLLYWMFLIIAIIIVGSIIITIPVGIVSAVFQAFKDWKNPPKPLQSTGKRYTASGVWVSNDIRPKLKVQ